MSGASHTPGPWLLDKGKPRALRFDDKPIFWVIANEARVSPCIVPHWGDPDGEGECAPAEAEANARLIAAAPEGFDVISRFRHKLETYVSVYPGDKELRGLLADCDAYIAKARGAA